jgi:superfamily II DNA/RNA helicase
MSNPKYIGFESEKGQEEENQAHLTQEINISKNLKQQYILMTEEERIPLMIAYLQLIKSSKVMIFASTIDEVEYLDYLLNNLKYKDAHGAPTEQRIEERRVFKIHGDLDQKYRTNTYLDFRKEKVRLVLVSRPS